jgi:predicted HTH transcriptional regulator
MHARVHRTVLRLLPALFLIDAPIGPTLRPPDLEFRVRGSPPPASAAGRGRRGRSDLLPLRVARRTIVRGESARVEFKQTARVNLSTKQRDQVIELMVVKSVAGFMNARGGTLLIGVTDRGEVFGLEKDLKTLGSKQDKDGFELWLTWLLDNMLGPTATSRISIAYEDLSVGTVCRIDVNPGKTPTFVRSSKGRADLYVRLNNSTRLLDTADAVEYVSSHWR